MWEEVPHPCVRKHPSALRVLLSLKTNARNEPGLGVSVRSSSALLRPLLLPHCPQGPGATTPWKGLRVRPGAAASCLSTARGGRCSGTGRARSAEAPGWPRPGGWGVLNPEPRCVAPSPLRFRFCAHEGSACPWSEAEVGKAASSFSLPGKQRAPQFPNRCHSL